LFFHPDFLFLREWVVIVGVGVTGSIDEAHNIWQTVKTNITTVAIITFLIFW